ncbi:PP2C family protein-serine/threonine phosphatase [Actinocorallia sp. A-T 12471]|uniref:PP2C family protein-serine/threonine phosphatase n=1 Tax=Actinocorallia sp. A-T 12471 TaxID=3089813 RepID=UPI0029CE1712|nr:PP2C family protein-serine/threonine phosphatase [Actinocorallia sp. A-T 12471]MDX6743931.1 PP2C family protein-serine/threonine phosphatase [Actinocorallia sp. A-T 12471]
MERAHLAGGARHCEVIHSPFGVRAIAAHPVGADPAALLGEVMRGFGELAMHETSLAGIAFRVDGFLSDRGEEYTSAVLVQFDPAGLDAEVICCGHAPPVIVRGDGRAEPCALPAALPLGLQALEAGWYTPTWIPLAPGDGLLLYSGGVTAVQRPYPFLTRIPRLASHDPSAFTEQLAADVRLHSADPTDLLLLLPETSPFRLERPRPQVPTLGPAWSDTPPP